MPARKNGKRTSELRVIDEPDHPIKQDIDMAARIAVLPKAQQEAAWKKYAHHAARANSHNVLGRADDRSVALRLKDVEGRDRLVIRVQPDGSPVLQLLDEQGKVTSQLPPASR